MRDLLRRLRAGWSWFWRETPDAEDEYLWWQR